MEKKKHHGRLVWQCSSNCFVKWFSGCVREPTYDDVHKAVANLQHFHIICLNTTVLKLPKRLPSWFGKEAARAKKAYPFCMSDREHERLVELNQLDLVLYEHICHTSATTFPWRRCSSRG
jgi:hypothetical protein